MKKFLKILSFALAYIACMELAVSEEVADELSKDINETLTAAAPESISEGASVLSEDSEESVSTPAVSSVSPQKEKTPLLFTFDIAADYTYDWALPASPIPGTMWDSNTVQWGTPDTFGPNGHLFHINGNCEWRWGSWSATAFAGINANFIPGFAKGVAYLCTWFVQAEAGLAQALFGWIGGFFSEWLPIFILTVVPALIWIAGIIILGGCMILLPLIMPLGFLLFSFPLFNMGVSADYHPYTNSWLDTKLSLGADVDLYRLITNAGVLGVFAQAEASVRYRWFKIYADAGYRADIRNIVFAAKGEEKYILSPYV